MMKKIKLLIVFVTALVMTTVITLSANTGYTYDHRGEPIYSTVGFTINQTPYLANDLGIESTKFTNPRDLFVYTDEEGNDIIYIVDGSSNALFVFNDSFELKREINSFTLDPTKINESVLREVKTGGQYLIARDQILSIPQSMETVNLLLNDEVTSSEERIRYEIDEPDFPYEITWTSSDEEVVTIEERDGEYFIVTQDLGQAVVYGEVYHADDLEAALEMVEIQVLVSEEPSEVEEDQKNFGFSYAELLAYGNVEIYLNELVGVYRAVTPSTGEDLIYLADRSNNQVVVIDSETFEIEKFVVTPDNVTFANKAFSPSEIVTDRAGRIYVIANNVFEGIMQFSREGEFNRYTGVNYVQLTPWQVFWRNIATESQLRKQQSIINTSFTGMTVDNEGFIYATSYALTDDNNLITDDNNMIKKINPTGNDILRRNGYHSPKGDLEYWQGENLAFYNGPSQFSSIAVNEYGLYSVIDNKMGRIFTYDNEGNLLYISGNARYQDGSNANTQTTVLRNPAAIAYLGEQLVVLDRNSRSVIIYEPTDIAKLINKAAELEYYGDRLGAAEYWTQVIQQNANYEYAYIGIGRMHLEEQNYVEAMEYFQFGEDRDLYSRAYKLERDKNIRKYFSPVVGSLIVLTVGLSVYKKVKNRHKPKEQDTGMGDE